MDLGTAENILRQIDSTMYEHIHTDFYKFLSELDLTELKFLAICGTIYHNGFAHVHDTDWTPEDTYAIDQFIRELNGIDYRDWTDQENFQYDIIIAGGMTAEYEYIPPKEHMDIIRFKNEVWDIASRYEISLSAKRSTINYVAFSMYDPNGDMTLETQGETYNEKRKYLSLWGLWRYNDGDDLNNNEVLGGLVTEHVLKQRLSHYFEYEPDKIELMLKEGFIDNWFEDSIDIISYKAVVFCPNYKKGLSLSQVELDAIEERFFRNLDGIAAKFLISCGSADMYSIEDMEVDYDANLQKQHREFIDNLIKRPEHARELLYHKKFKYEEFKRKHDDDFAEHHWPSREILPVEDGVYNPDQHNVNVHNEMVCEIQDNKGDANGNNNIVSPVNCRLSMVCPGWKDNVWCSGTYDRDDESLLSNWRRCTNLDFWFIVNSEKHGGFCYWLPTFANVSAKVTSDYLHILVPLILFLFVIWKNVFNTNKKRRE